MLAVRWLIPISVISISSLVPSLSTLRVFHGHSVLELREIHDFTSFGCEFMPSMD
jgi:hypothetical protein